MEYLESIGYSVTYLDVDKYGMVTPESVKNAIQEDTILVSIMAANNEIGTINPIAKIGKICKEKNIPFMVDAIQAYGKIPLNPKEMGISLMSMSGHKIYAPKGIGALFVEKGALKMLVLSLRLAKQRNLRIRKWKKKHNGLWI